MEKFLNNNIAIFTGDSYRHNYFANELSKSLNVKLMVFEKKINLADKLNLNEYDRLIINEHFKSRDISEVKYFGEYKNLLKGKENILNIENGLINEDFIINELTNKNINYIILFGCSIIKNKILDKFQDRVINLHLGLSPYYRGSGTNFWPLVDELPECVGATIHITDSKIDAGGILHQVRPEIKTGDDINDLGNKTIIKAVEDIPKLISQLILKKVNPTIQDLSKGKLCKRKDFTAESVLKMRENFKIGMIDKFLKDKENRLKSYKIVKGF